MFPARRGGRSQAIPSAARACYTREPPWTRLHLCVGLVGALAFLATGQYMDLALDHLRGMDDAQRLLFRSTHIYLQFASLLNLALGLALAAFCTEMWLTGLERSYSRLTAFASLGGMLLHALARLPWRARPTFEG